MVAALKHLFDLKHDQDDNDIIDRSIRCGIRIGGSNLWALIFAILIASVGLNVNSTAVVIGAMLISPIMVPLLGIGYGAGINDFLLIKQSARVLLIFVSISLATSTLYFLVSPLSQAQTELLARTSPTIWDVLIAFFGGCAGIVAQTRKEISTVIPGVAIATALMPPLCTAGYGLATGRFEFFYGAFFLFTINAFFIAFATLVFVKLLRLPQHEEADARLQRHTRLVIATCVIAMLVPSAILTYRLVKDQQFISAANQLLSELEQRPGAILLAREITPRSRKITLTFGGAALPPDIKQQMDLHLRMRGFTDTTLVLRHLGSDKVDVVALKVELQRDVYSQTLRQLEERNAKIDSLHQRLNKQQADMLQLDGIVEEVLAQYPNVKRLTVAEGEQSVRDDDSRRTVLVLALETDQALGARDIKRLEAWMNVKFPKRLIRIAQSPFRDIPAEPVHQPRPAHRDIE